MKMSINSMLLISTLSVAVWGCAAADTVVGVDPANVKTVTANVNANALQIVGSANSEDSTKFDFYKDHSYDIQQEINDAIHEALTIQNEIDRVEKIAKKYADYSSDAVTPEEKKIADGLARTVWETELNTLCTRVVGKIYDVKKREKLLEDQRSWNAIKEEVMKKSIGEDKNGEVLDSKLVSEFMENTTRSRCLVLAYELAQSNDEEFKFPERSVYGTFVDMQDSDTIGSILVTRKGADGSNEAVFSIHQMAVLEGTFKDKGDGELEFTGKSSNVKGIIKINGWKDATLEITQSNDKIYNAGLSYTFDFAF
ncbi:MAG: hypothetical protein II586_06455 [Butyrivibrio sp.]|jgi:hypothetical protein|nr:hypothetical protein [Butyrivibrio sp.]MBQ4220831.1 hypothetical protein [Butyrivibrio sp.]MEE3471480.1 hypothetical protein [Butyrivibrio hungatei]